MTRSEQRTIEQMLAGGVWPQGHVRLVNAGRPAAPGDGGRLRRARLSALGG